jgi:hypothetical protein
MPLRELFPFRGREDQRFLGWPPPPSIQPLRARAEGVVSARFDSNGKDKEQEEDKYHPTLIVAIGKTGEQTMELLAEKIAQSSASGSASIRALLITESPPLMIPKAGRQIRVLELQQPAASSTPKGSSHSLRSSTNILFQQVVNYKRYQEWLHETLLDLGADIQVFFVGSIAEITIGLMGDSIQILSNFSRGLGKPRLISRVCAFLSLRSLSSFALPAEEVFASYREISRYTFNGPHGMNPSFGQESTIELALLDYLFILDDVLPITLAEKQEVNIAQLLADSLFSLIHPSARFLWENLLNDLPLSGRIRQESHQSVVHGIGNATLYIPITEIKRYISARLAHAVLFGEQADLEEGLVKPSSSLKENPQFLARRFLLNGPFPHPVYKWLLDASSSNYFNAIPDLSTEFVLVFQAQIAHSLTQYLNQSPVDFGQACAALDWLETHLKKCENWLSSSKPDNPNAPERFTFQHILFKWRESLRFLSDDLANWQKKMLFSPAPAIPAVTAVSTSDWRNTSSIVSDWRQGNSPGSSQTPANVSETLKAWRMRSEAMLSKSSNDPIYRSVLADANGGLKELELYYADTVRPELSRIGTSTGTSFARIRQQLEWWIQVTPDRLPQLYLVCWPATMQPATVPTSEVRFRSDQVQEFAAALMELTLSQTESLESDLTINWFGRRLRHMADFLHRADDAFIEYDRNQAAHFANAASRRSYLISYDPTLSRDLVTAVFPNTPRLEINELSGGQKTRFTAITLRLNIPFDTINKLQEFRREYSEKQSESIHLYSQERTAVVYEKRLWKLHRSRILLSPEIVTLLVDPHLVTLFFQSLFTGVLHVEQDEIDNQSYWTLKAVKEFSSLRLAPLGKDGLYSALRHFALELPNAADINQNPQNHFHPSRRLHYISSLTALSKELAFKPETRDIRESLKVEFDVWKSRAELDELARSFHTLIVCELDEPVWTGW